jgi:hypothetical protein
MTQINEIKTKVDGENSKNSKRLSTKGPVNDKEKPKEKPNHFSLPPFK